MAQFINLKMHGMHTKPYSVKLILFCIPNVEMLLPVSIRKAKSSFETSLASNVKKNPSLFWKYVRSNSKVWNDVLAITKDDGCTTSSDYETANFFF